MKTAKQPTTDHDQRAGFELVTFFGGPAGGERVMLDYRQDTATMAGAKYHRTGRGQFVADDLLRGAWGGGR